MEFDWDSANTDHIARHKVEPEEAQEALQDPYVVPIEPIHRGPRGQRRFAVVGATDAGWVLFVVFELRGEKVRVVTARAASPDERARYETEE